MSKTNEKLKMFLSGDIEAGIKQFLTEEEGSYVELNVNEYHSDELGVLGFYLFSTYNTYDQSNSMQVHSTVNLRAHNKIGRMVGNGSPVVYKKIVDADPAFILIEEITSGGTYFNLITIK